MTSLWGFGGVQFVPVRQPLDQVGPGRLGATNAEWFPVCLALLWFGFKFPPLETNRMQLGFKLRCLAPVMYCHAVYIVRDNCNTVTLVTPLLKKPGLTQMT